MKKYLLLPMLLLIVFLSGFSAPPQDTFLVERVVDGDTIKLANGERVRYLGIDTPETKHPTKPVQYFGPEAYQANKKLVQGKIVRLEFDGQKKDKYDRLLAYVYVDDIFVNAWLVKNGFAKVLTYPPNVKKTASLLKLQQKAKEAGIGLWGK